MELAKCESKRKSAFADFLKVRTPSVMFQRLHIFLIIDWQICTKQPSSVQLSLDYLKKRKNWKDNINILKPTNQRNSIEKYAICTWAAKNEYTDEFLEMSIYF